MKYIFNFGLDVENRRRRRRSIKVKMVRYHKILCCALILLWCKFNQHAKKKKFCLACCHCSHFPHKATQLYYVTAMSPCAPSKAKRSAWCVGLQFNNLQKIKYSIINLPVCHSVTSQIFLNLGLWNINSLISDGSKVVTRSHYNLLRQESKTSWEGWQQCPCTTTH
jgi:hypothetical protein